MSDATILQGSRPRELPRPNRTFGAGRVCAEEGCGTKLSTYNRHQYCWAHTPTRFPLVRGERRRSAA